METGYGPEQGVPVRKRLHRVAGGFDLPASGRRVGARAVSLLVLVALGYVVGYELASRWFSAEDQGASFFPAAGVTLAALVLVRRRLWPVVLAAAALSELTLDISNGTDVLASMGYALANTAEPLVGALLLTTLVPRVDLRRTRDLGAFIGCAVMVGPIVGAVIAATTWVTIGGGSGWARFAFEWWCGDGLGVLVVGGALISLRSRPHLPLHRQVEAVAIAALALAATVTVFEVGWFEFVYVPVALLVVLAFRTGTTGVAITGALVAFLAAGLTAESQDFWASVEISPANRVLYMQLALGVLISAVLALAAEISERERIAVELARTESEREAAMERAELFDAERAARERADDQARRLELLYATAEKLASATCERDVAGVLIDQAVEAFGADRGAVALVRPDTTELEVIAARGFPDETVSRYRRVPLDRTGAAQDVVRGGRAVWIESPDDYVARYPELGDEYRSLGLGAQAAIPLPGERGPAGLLGLDFRSPKTFAPADRESLLALARQASFAFQRAASFEQEQDARRRAEVLERHVARLAVATVVTEVAEATLAGLAEVGLRAAWVQLLGDDGQLELVAETGVPAENLARYGLYPLVDAATPPAEAVRTHALVGVGSFAELEERFPDAVSGARRLGVESFFTMPLTGTDGDIIGALSGASVEPRWLDESRTALVVALAEQCGLGLERAALRAVANAAVADTTLLAQLGEVLVRPTHSHQRARALVEVLTIERAALAVVHLLGDDGRPLLLERSLRPRAASIEEGAIVELAALAAVSSDGVSTSVDGLELLALPLRARDETLGVLTVGFGSEETGVSPGLFRRIAIRAALALDNALLYERERAVSHSLQLGLLGDAPTAPSGVEIATAYRPGTAALEVGGDWYDAFTLADGRLAILVGDVVGHGLEAAVAMGQLRGAVRALAPMGPPREVLARLDALVETLPEAGMATIAYAELDITDGKVVYACAGHPPPLVVPTDGEPRLLWEGRSAPLGSAYAHGREQAETRLDPGDTLVLYTDGLVERRTTGISERLDLLVEVAGHEERRSSEELVDHILESMLDEDQEDDVCLLAVERVPQEIRFVQSFPALPSEVASLRRGLSAWLEEVALSEQERRDAVLAVSEAAANAAEHAYGFDGSGLVRVEARVSAGHLVVTIRDRGTWREPRRDTDRGRGRIMMEALMRDVTIDTGVDGTVVQMRLPTSGGVAV